MRGNGLVIVSPEVVVWLRFRSDTNELSCAESTLHHCSSDTDSGHLTVSNLVRLPSCFILVKYGGCNIVDLHRKMLPPGGQRTLMLI